jgi:microcystin degradation protein MlrC
MISLQRKAARFEREAGCACVSINAGFSHADVYDIGPCVTVTGEGDGARFQEMAEELMDDIWDTRDIVNNRYLSVEEAAARAAVHSYRGRPVIIADYADNPGAGSYGDATNLLRAMLEADLEGACFGALRDEEAAARLCAAGRGARMRLALGGKVDPRFGGGPLELAGEVVAVTDGSFVYDGPMWSGTRGSLGKTAVLRVGGIDVMVVSNLQQITDIQQFKANGIDPLEKRVIALKSMQHFRAAYQPIADAVWVCDGGGLASPDLSRLEFKKVRRPIYPLDGR